MAVPDFQSMMFPLLTFASDRKEHQMNDFKNFIRDHFNLSNDDLNEMVSSGTPRYTRNIYWAIAYLYQAGLLNRVTRGVYVISDSGIAFQLKMQPKKKISSKDLFEFDSFKRFAVAAHIKGSNTESTEVTPSNTEESPSLIDKTPEESIQDSYNMLCSDLAKELLGIIKEHSPAFFESLVVDLLIKMGYGGSRIEAGQVVGKSGDGGIDGIIKEDKLGLDVIYIQAKRYDGAVPIKEVRDFAGALTLKKSHKGIFLTTSTFPDSAYNFVKDSSLQIVLIDGERLAELMIEHNVGVSVRETYQIKRIDSDYFNEDDM